MGYNGLMELHKLALQERTMSVEIHDRLIKLLADVDELRAMEATLQAEKVRHQEQIAQSEGDLQKCLEAIRECQENGKLLKSQMDTYRDELFGIEEITTPTSEASEEESAIPQPTLAKKKWDAHAKLVKSGAA
jgi:uncharacterized coiled-coil DUF342 family protein